MTRFAAGWQTTSAKARNFPPSPQTPSTSRPTPDADRTASLVVASVGGGISQQFVRGYYQAGRTTMPKVAETWKHEFVLANGIRFHCITQGSNDRPLVLLLHGFPENHYSWRYQMA